MFIINSVGNWWASGLYPPKKNTQTPHGCLKKILFFIKSLNIVTRTITKIKLINKQVGLYRKFLKNKDEEILKLDKGNNLFNFK